MVVVNHGRIGGKEMVGEGGESGWKEEFFEEEGYEEA